MDKEDETNDLLYDDDDGLFPGNTEKPFSV